MRERQGKKRKRVRGGEGKRERKEERGEKGRKIIGREREREGG